LLNYTQVQVKVLQSDVYLSKSTEVLVFKSTWVSRVQEYTYCITTATVLTFMYRNVLHGVIKKCQCQ